MARPRKQPADRRDRKLIVWMSAKEQARFLVNATRVGMTGADYVRAVACGEVGARSEKREIILALDGARHATLLARAGIEARPVETLIADLLDAQLGVPAKCRSSSVDFELIDALSRVGVALTQMVAIAQATNTVPNEIGPLLDRIDRLLDRMLPP